MILATTTDIAFWSQSMADSTQPVLGFDLVLQGPITASSAISRVQEVMHISLLQDLEWKLDAMFGNLPTGGSTITTPRDTNRTTLTPSPDTSDNPGSFDYLGPVSAQYLIANQRHWLTLSRYSISSHFPLIPRQVGYISFFYYCLVFTQLKALTAADSLMSPARVHEKDPLRRLVSTSLRGLGSRSPASTEVEVRRRRLWGGVV